MSDIATPSDRSNEYLFACLAEQLKIPMVQVSQIAQTIDQAAGNISKSKQAILEISQASQKLIDGFLLNLEISDSSVLDLEPVSIGSVLYDTADSLQEYARLHDCRLELSVSGRNGPVMARADALKSAVENLTISFINMPSDGDRVVKLVLRRVGQVVSTGVFSQSPAANKTMLSRARNLYGRAHQPLADLTSDTSAGIFLADRLITGMGSSIKVSNHGKLNGLSATFSPSRQLSLV